MVTKDTEIELKRIEAFVKEGKSAVLMLCNAEHLPEFHRLIVEEVMISQDDIYHPPGEKVKFALHLRALERLGGAAQIEWIPEVTKMQSMSAEGDVCHYTATGFYTREFNNRVSMQGEGYTNLKSVKRALVVQYTAKAEKGRWDKNKKGAGRNGGYVDWSDDAQRQDYINYCVDRDYLPKEDKILQNTRAEATAQVYRKLLGLGGSYSQEMFDHPVVIVRCVVAVDPKDAEQMKLIQTSGIQAIDAIYGPKGGRALPMPVSNSGNYSGQDGDTIIPEYTVKDEPDLPSGDPESSNEGGEPEERPKDLVEFRQLHEDDQRAELSRLVTEKDYEFSPKDTGGLWTLEEMKPKQFGTFFDILIVMENDDIPF